MDDLDALLGAGWYDRAGRPTSAPALLAALTLLADHHVQGIAKLRANLSRNPSRDELRHGLLQARLAAVAVSLGIRPILEPPVGDLVLDDVLLELRGLNRASGGTSRRLVRAIELKAKQTRTAPAAWVWLTDDGAFEGLDLAAATGLSRVLADWPHLHGVVLDGPLPIGFPRSTRFGPLTVVHRPGLPPNRWALIHRLCAAVALNRCR
ncbi:hypothetical protein [Dactylosporangium sp. CS-033363]|uniref:hypothetical protein n=1 Tax=Dactylosporangium sp. CS-033363 TaxID=3239935 RepID=UPI003D8E6FFC